MGAWVSSTPWGAHAGHEASPLGGSSWWPGAGPGGGAASGQAGAGQLLAEAPHVSWREADGLVGMGEVLRLLVTAGQGGKLRPGAVGSPPSGPDAPKTACGVQFQFCMITEVTSIERRRPPLQAC